MLSDSLLQYLHSAEKKYMLGVQIERSQTEFREVNLPSGLSVLTRLSSHSSVLELTELSFLGFPC